MDRRRSLAAALLAPGWLTLPRVAAAAPPAARDLTITLRIRVARCQAPGEAAGAAAAEPARPTDWVDQHVAAARALLRPHGIEVAVASIDDFRPERCELLTRADRDALASEVPVDGDPVTVLVMPRVRDLDVPTYDLMGVHWRAGGRRWIYLTGRARPPVLAHELCHFFGLPHDRAGGNLMAPGPSSPAWKSKRPPRPFAPVLTRAQVARLRAGVAAHRFATRSGGKNPAP